jgi:hypothetical protein
MEGSHLRAADGEEFDAGSFAGHFLSRLENKKASAQPRPIK